MDEPEFPVLGTEPLPVEFANTRYDGTDFLGTAGWVDLWFARMGGDRVTAMGADARRVRVLRDGVREVLAAAVDGRPADREALDEVNRAASAAPTTLRLDQAADGTLTTRSIDTTTGATAVLGRLATCCIELVAGPAAGNLRRCDGPGCSLFFVKDHPRRRFCHPSCGHRDRQARYYRRRLARGRAQ